MDRSALTRKRTREAPPNTKPPTSASPNKDGRTSPQKQTTRSRPSTAPESQPPRPSPGKIRKARDSSEITRAKLGDVGVQQEEMTAAEDDRESQHFTVGGVGAGGTLYLTPSRMPPQTRFSTLPSTPPRTAERVESIKTLWPGTRASNASADVETPRAQGSAYDYSVPVPPISLANSKPKRRPRSHSFSTLSERERSRVPTLDSTDVQDFRFFLNGKRRSVSQRPKSTMNLGEGMLQHYIPHYRLGTPRFSARGTAYLHNSVYTMTTNDDGNSSVFTTQAEFDKLFPAPPRRSASYQDAPYQGPPGRTPPTKRTSLSPQSNIRTFVFEKIQANPNDPSTVRFSPAGKIIAATPARLVAQITSPDFLDYELLSDFFLTFRGFLSCADLLEYLLARMRWALGDAADSGRIARVRTFVALRHWILNYFQDDFMYNYDLRLRFCELVNQMCNELSQRPDKGGGDLNILGELKKCWTRTCALYWQMPDTTDSGADALIQPGGDYEYDQVRASLMGSPSAAKQQRIGDSQQAALAPQVAAETGMHSAPNRHSSMIMAASTRSPIPSMQTPGSPMSDLSLQVVSCSVPFFSSMRPSTNPLRSVLAPRPVGSRMPPVSLGQSRPSHQHKRSGSFSDALRDERTPLPSAKIDSTELRELPNITLTAGLVRGLVVKPSSTQVQVLVPTSPGPKAPEPRVGRTIAIEEPVNVRHSQHHAGVKRIVGDMRRVLSTRKPTRSPARSHKSVSSSGSKTSNPVKETTPQEKEKPVAVSQPPKGPPRHDILGEAAAKAYSEANEDEDAARNSQSTARPIASAHDSVKPDSLGLLKQPGHDRVLSQVTTSSQSIMIVDATGPQEDIPIISQSLPSVSTWSCTMTPAPLLSRNSGHEHTERQDYFGDIHVAKENDKVDSSHNEYRESSEPSLHGLITMQEDWRTTRSAIPYEYQPHVASAPARKSSGVQSPTYEMPPIRNPIRRVPGGDLKNAGHVHDLESEPRVQSSATMSTISRSFPTSYDLSGTHFSGQGLPMQITSLPARTAPKESLGLLDTPSQPYIRKSIKEDVWRLAKMPDSSPGGGVEDALLKLEGRYAGRRASTQGLFSPSVQESITASGTPSKRASIMPPYQENGDIIMGDMGLLSPTTDRQGASIFRDSGSDVFTLSRRDTASEEVDGMYEMDDVDEDSTAPVLQNTSHLTMYPIPSLASGRPSYDEPQQAPAAGQTQPQRQEPSRAMNSDSDGSRPGASQMSFLLDDNESLSEISTELTDSPNGGGDLGVRSFFFDDTVEEGYKGQPFQAPPTPPSTAGAPVAPSPEQKIPYYPSVVPGKGLKEMASAPGMLTNASAKPELQSSQSNLRLVKTTPELGQPTHLPFIFAYSSSVIAEQLTIIEKDALDEMNWKDLIGLNWHQNPPQVRNWVTYLRSSESDNGIDLIIARFNLVVKWVVSEIVLTRSANERARAITKFIHIASHCLRIKNYASTYQITLALLSTDITRLKRTWYLVPTSEKTNLARLERLCQPVRNFAALRTEMEAASLAQGCIPFIGLYTHDLMYNAQKPGRINALPGAASAARVGTRGHESLINFERYQTSAVIAKSLLRLLEASARYGLKPDGECLSRCLWLAALDDGEIAERSRALE